jgi:hypothetical protein
VQRLISAAKESTVRGMLTRASLRKRVEENILDQQTVRDVTPVL